MNHPNRNRNSSTATPTGAQVRAAREAAGLTPREAGALVYERHTRWLAFEEDRARLHPAAWELFQLKTERPTMEPRTPTGRILSDYIPPFHKYPGK